MLKLFLQGGTSCHRVQKVPKKKKKKKIQKKKVPKKKKKKIPKKKVLKFYVFIYNYGITNDL